MSIFPTKILLATDGSREAILAARTAVDLADKTGSELHVAFVLSSAQSMVTPLRQKVTLWVFAMALLLAVMCSSGLF